MNEPQRLTPPTSHPMAIVAPATGRSASDSSVTVSSAPAATATTTTPYVTTPYVGCVGGVQNAPTQVNSVKLIEDSRSSLFSQEVVNGNEDENNSGGQQQAQTENQADQGQYDRVCTLPLTLHKRVIISAHRSVLLFLITGLPCCSHRLSNFGFEYSTWTSCRRGSD